MTLQEKLDKRAGLIAEQRAFNDAIEAEGREYTAEDNEQFDKRHADIEKLTEQIDRERRLAEQEDWTERSAGRFTTPAAEKKAEEPDAEKAFRSFLRYGTNGMASQEVRALQADNDTGGGYTIPDMFLNQLIQAVDDATFMQGISTMHQVPYGATLGVPSLDTDLSDASWTPEITSVTEDTALAFGRREFTPNQLAKLVKVSRPLLRSSAIDMEAKILERLGHRHGTAAENAYMTGSGAQQPLGIFTASSQGISTTYDVSTGNTTTSITFDGLKEAKYELKQNYWRNASWIFHRDAVKQISKLKDGEGQYIWQQSVSAGDPDMLLGFPMRLSEFAPSTFQTGEYVGILGDFSYYHIAMSLNATIQRLDELYAATNQVGFIGRMEIDGMPVLGEAFRRVTLA